MRGITPFVRGETAHLQAAVEAVFTSEAAAVEDQLHYLDAQIRALGYEATFGMEIEAMARPNPGTHLRAVSLFDNIYFYEKTVEEILGAKIESQPTWDKGEAILPELNQSPIMVQSSPVSDGALNRYNLDQDAFFEIQTAPANACTAKERYWRVIEAIGQVAKKHGCYAAILSTHVSSGFRRIGEEELIHLWTPEGARLIAAVQHILNAAEPLQFHAGFLKGYRVTEAYPSKHASTAWHQFLAEQRLPNVGITDPRVVMLCTLAAANQFANDAIPLAILQNIHKCVKYSTITEPEDVDNGLGRLLSNSTALWDTVVESFVLPTVIQPNAVHVKDEKRIDSLTRLVSNGTEQSTIGDNGRTLRKFVGQLCLEKYNVRPRPGVTFPPDIITILRQLTAVSDKKTSVRYRYLPQIEADSPAIQLQRRRRVIRSPIVKSMLGPVSRHLTSAERGMEIRQDFIGTFG